MRPAGRLRPRTAMFFPGQGVQRVGMLQAWLAAFPRTARPLLDEMDATLAPLGPARPLTAIVADGPHSLLTATENAQPAIMATSVLILRVLEADFGFRTADRVDFVLGHSLGEFAALVAAAILPFAHALRLVRIRAEVMAGCARQARLRLSGSTTTTTITTSLHGRRQDDQPAPEVGMVALVCENAERCAMLVDAVHHYLDAPPRHRDTALTTAAAAAAAAADPINHHISVANINSKNQIVLSGSIDHINALLAHLRQFGGHDPRHVRLKSDAPFHSRWMAPAADTVRRLLNNTPISTPISTTTTTTNTSAPLLHLPHPPIDPQHDSIPIKFPGIMPCISNVSARPFASEADLKDLLARSCVDTVLWWDSIKYLDRQERVRRWIGLGPGKVGRNLVGKEVGMKGPVRGGGVWAVTEPHEMEDFVRTFDATDDAEED